MQSPDLGVDVWLVESSAGVRRTDLDLLSDRERRRAARFRRAQDAALFTTARAGLRRRLGTIIGVAPREVPLLDPPGAKPHLEPPLDSLSFSVSHSAGRALIALCDGGRVGVDLERVEQVPSALLESALTETERRWIAGLPDAARHRAFYQFWTRKEALLKAAGTGLATDMAEVTLSVTDPPQLLDWPHGPAGDWQLRSLFVGEDWEAVAAVEAQERPVHMRLHPPHPADGEG